MSLDPRLTHSDFFFLKVIRVMFNCTQFFDSGSKILAVDAHSLLYKLSRRVKFIGYSNKANLNSFLVNFYINYDLLYIKA